MDYAVEALLFLVIQYDHLQRCTKIDYSPVGCERGQIVRGLSNDRKPQSRRSKSYYGTGRFVHAAVAGSLGSCPGAFISSMDLLDGCFKEAKTHWKCIVKTYAV